MDAITAALADQQAELDGLLADLDEAGWRKPSRCAGWTIADVVLHMAQTDEFAVASDAGRTGPWQSAGDEVIQKVDDAAQSAVESQRGASGAALLDRWRRAAAAELTFLRSCDPRRRLPWITGELPARTLATTRLSETWIHSGDVADGLGVELAPTDRLWHIARLAWRTLPYAFARAGRELSGPVEVHLTGPGGDAWDFVHDDKALTSVRGPAVEFCLLAAQRVEPVATSLVAEGPDATGVLELVRTYA